MAVLSVSFFAMYVLEGHQSRQLTILPKSPGKQPAFVSNNTQTLQHANTHGTHPSTIVKFQSRLGTCVHSCCRLLTSDDTVAVQWVAWDGLTASHMETSSTVHDISILQGTEVGDLAVICCADSVHLA
jgi:hypothetical protein